MEALLEILKYILPALIVFATSYYILKKLVDNQYHLQVLEFKNKYSKEAIPLKLQSYERLILFCDRISIPNLIMRLKTKEMKNIELKNVMMISVQKEFEHNIAQQLYTSTKLWEIISLAKTDVMSFIELHSNNIDPDALSIDLANKLLTEHHKLKKDPIDLAILAIREEAKIILNA